MDNTEFDREVALCAYKTELTEEEANLIAQEKVLCRAVFTRFLKWVRILGTPTQDNPGGLIPFSTPPYILQLIYRLLTERYLSILKARQTFVSTTIATYKLWRAKSQLGFQSAVFSEGEDAAAEFLAKGYRIHQYLPDFLKEELSPSSTEHMGFPSMSSFIKARASTETALVGYTLSALTYDEHDAHRYAHQSFFHAKPTIDSCGGQLISVFTRNPWNPESLPKQIFEAALKKQNEFFPIFIPWYARPDRDKDWYRRTMGNLTAQELQGLTPELYMQKNYPATIQEALSPISALSAFDGKVLEEMMEDVKNPIREGLPATLDPKVVHIYQPFHLGEYYIAGTDTSLGTGKDNSVTAVMNVRTGAVVADIMNNRISPEELAFHSVELLKFYHNPLWYPECNSCGGITIAAAQRLGYTNFGYQDEKKTKIGFNTLGYGTPTGIKGTRTDLFAGLCTAINNHQITIFNSDGLREFYHIVRNVKNGKFETALNKHDDYAIALGICWAKKGEVRTEPWNLKPIEGLHFRRRG